MSGNAFTIRDLEQARRRERHRRRERTVAEARDYLITFAIILACWLARELFLSF